MDCHNTHSISDDFDHRADLLNDSSTQLVLKATQGVQNLCFGVDDKF